MTRSADVFPRPDTELVPPGPPHDAVRHGGALAPGDERPAADDREWSRTAEGHLGLPAATWTEPDEASTPRQPAPLDKSVRYELLKLVQRVFLPIGAGEASRSVLFTTAAPSRDPETVSGATAEILAQHTGRTICLVDANLRDPSLHRRFETENSAGLSDLLSGTRRAAEVAQPLAANLWLVAAGPRSTAAVPTREALQRSVGNLLATFDFVVFGASSLGVESDAIGLAPAVDGVVLLVDAGATRRAAARRAIETLQGSNARLLGVVLNRRSPGRSTGGRWW